MRLGKFSLGVLALASAASARIADVKGLACSGGEERFSLTFDHEGQRAALSDGKEIRLLSYEQGEAFLTWRLVDDQGRPLYLLREGDRQNGDFGWYFSLVFLDAEGGTQVQPGGECKVVD